MGAISLPVEAMLIAPREALQFLHVGEVELARPLTALEVWQRSTADDLPLLPLAFRVRDGISGLFGVARALTGMNERVTFIIDEKGRIAHVLDDPNCPNHGEEVLKFL